MRAWRKGGKQDEEGEGEGGGGRGWGKGTEGGKREAGTYIIQLILQLGPVILKKIVKIALLYVGWDWQKVYKLVLEKAFFFSLWCFYLVLVILSKNF